MDDAPLSKKEVERFDKLFARVPENYEILNREGLPVFGKYSYDSDYVRQLLVQDADRLVAILDGTIPERELAVGDGEKEAASAPDVVIALDKSGRPLKAVAETFWEMYAKEGAKMPEFDFLNIDRIDWLQRMGMSIQEAEESTQKTLDFSVVSDEEIARIRAYFVEGDLTEENWQEEVWKLPTRLDGKEVLVLDEVKNSGATLAIAAELIHRAIPEAKVTGEYFWTNRIHKVVNGEIQYGTVPPWYDRTSSMGRGIGDVDISYYNRRHEIDQTQESLKKKLAAFVLSAPHHDKETLEVLEDKKYQSLLQDLAYLTYEPMPFFPSTDRDDDSWDDRLDDMERRMNAPLAMLMKYRRQKADEQSMRAKR